MPTKKAKPTESSPGKTQSAPPHSAAASVLTPPPNGNTQRLLREAAWTRMFGRVEAKNPFTRSR